MQFKISRLCSIASNFLRLPKPPKLEKWPQTFAFHVSFFIIFLRYQRVGAYNALKNINSLLSQMKEITLTVEFLTPYKLTKPLCEEIWLSDLKIDHCVFQKIRCSADQLSFPGSWNESINAVILQFGHKAYSSPKVGFLTVHLTTSNNKPAGTPRIEPAAAGCQSRKLSIVLFPVTG